MLLQVKQECCRVPGASQCNLPAVHPGDPDLLDAVAAFQPLLPPICVTQKPVDITE